MYNLFHAIHHGIHHSYIFPHSKNFTLYYSLRNTQVAHNLEGFSVQPSSQNYVSTKFRRDGLGLCLVTSLKTPRTGRSLHNQLHCLVNSINPLRTGNS